MVGIRFRPHAHARLNLFNCCRIGEVNTAQGETSVQITEGIGALLSLILGSVDGSGVLRCSASASPATLRFGLDAGLAERVVPALTALGKVVGFTAETSGAETVILSFPEPSSTEHPTHE